MMENNFEYFQEDISIEEKLQQIKVFFNASTFRQLEAFKHDNFDFEIGDRQIRQMAKYLKQKAEEFKVEVDYDDDIQEVSFQNDFVEKVVILVLLSKMCSKMMSIINKQDEKVSLKDILGQKANAFAEQPLVFIDNSSLSFSTELSEDKEDSYTDQYYLLFSIYNSQNMSQFRQILKSLQNEPKQYTFWMLIIRKIMTKSNPESEDNIKSLGSCLYNSGFCKKALQVLSELQQRQIPEVLEIQGKCLKWLKMYEYAIKYFDWAYLKLKNDQHSELKYRCQFEVGQLSLKINKIFEGIFYYQRCIQMKPDAIHVVALCATAYFQTRMYQEAYYTLHRFIEDYVNELQRFGKMQIAMLWSLMGEVSIQFKKRNQDPFEQPDTITNSSIFQYFSKADQLIILYQLQEGIDPKKLRNRQYCAVNSLRKGIYQYEIQNNIDMALQYFKQSEKAKPTLRCYIWKAKMHLLQQNIKQFQYCWSQIEILFERSQQNFKYLYFQLLQLCRDAEKSYIVNQMDQKVKADLKKLAIVQKDQFKNNLTSQTHQITMKLKKRFSRINHALQISGHYLLKTFGLNDYAEYTFNLMRQLDDDIQNTQIVLGQCKMIEKNYQKAVKFFYKVSISSIHEIPVIKDMIKAFEQQNEDHKVVQCSKRILELDPNDGQTLQKLSFISIKMKNIDEALKYLFESCQKIGLNHTSFSLIKKIIKTEKHLSTKIFTTLEQIEKMADLDYLQLCLECQEYAKAKQNLAKPQLETAQDIQRYFSLFLMFVNKSGLNYEEEREVFNEKVPIINQAEENAKLIGYLAQLHEKYQNFKKAGDLYEKLYTKFNKKECLNKIIKCFKEAGDKEKSQKYLQAERKDLQEEIKPFFEEMRPQLVQSSFVVIEEDPDLVTQKLINLYSVYKQEKRSTFEVQVVLKKLIERIPEKTYFCKQLIQFFMRQAKISEASQYQKYMIQKDPFDQDNYTFFLDNFSNKLKEKTQQEAQQILEEVYRNFFSQDEKKPQKKVCKILFYASFNRYPKAMEEFNIIFEEFCSLKQKDKSAFKKKQAVIPKYISHLKKKQDIQSKKIFFILMMGILYQFLKKQNLAKKKCQEFQKELEKAAKEKQIMYEILYKQTQKINVSTIYNILNFLLCYLEVDSIIKVEEEILEKFMMKDGLTEHEKFLLQSLSKKY